MDSIVSLRANSSVPLPFRFVPGLFKPDNPSFAEILGAGARGVVVLGEEAEGRRRALTEYLEHWRRRGRLDGFDLVALDELRRSSDWGTVLEIVRRGIAHNLRRNDPFVVLGDRGAIDQVGMAAAMYRRSCRCVRVLDSLDQVRFALRRGPTARIAHQPSGLGAAGLGARMRKIQIVVDRDAVSTGRWELPELGGPEGPRDTTVWFEDRVEYSVHFTRDLFTSNGELLDGYLGGAQRILALVDSYPRHRAAQLEAFFSERLAAGAIQRVEIHPMRISSRGKTLEGVQQVLDRARALGLRATDRLLAVGGGTLMDTVGFAAALHEGHVPYLRIPTTLVGQIDAGVGLKVGVNFDGRKNFVGAYYPPCGCLCDMTLLETLPAAELRCGLAEAIKIAIMCDAGLFERIEAHYLEVLSGTATPLVERVLLDATAAMLAELEANPFEHELRRLPDFGHELGHLIESLSTYRLLHGEAVAIGMALSCHLAWSLGILPRDQLVRILELLLHVGLPIFDPVCTPQRLWRGIFDDILPHKAGKLYLVVPLDIGQGGFIDEVEALRPAMLEAACAELESLAAGALARGVQEARA